MRYRKTLLLALCCSLLHTANLHAYDTQGKFGMGIRMTGTPVILFSNMKIGLTNFLTLEPSIGFSQFKLARTDTVFGSMGTVEQTFKLEDKYNAFIGSAVADLKPLRFERSNLVIKVGGTYWRASALDEYVNTAYGPTGDPQHSKDSYDDAIWALLGKAGMGVEHFFTDHMSVYAGFVSAIALFGSDEQYYDYVSAKSIGNQFAELSFIWYLK